MSVGTPLKLGLGAHDMMVNDMRNKMGLMQLGTAREGPGKKKHRSGMIFKLAALTINWSHTKPQSVPNL
jgi:hypothetical protein